MPRTKDYVKKEIEDLSQKFKSFKKKCKMRKKDVSLNDMESLSYHAPKIKNCREAIYWFAALLHTSILSVETITLINTINPQNGKNAITFDTLEYDLTYTFLKNEIIKRHTDDISLLGTYRKRPIVLGINLHTGRIVVCYFKYNEINTKELERQLKLVAAT